MAENSNRLSCDAGRADGLGHVVKGRTTSRGFSLLEMILVIAIIAGISVLAAAVTTGGLQGMRLRSSANEIAAQLRFTHAQALATGEPQSFSIDPHGHSWQAPKGRHGEISASLGVLFIGARETQPSEGVGAIVFFPDGGATGGRVQLQAKQAAWNIDVAWLTGEVKVARAEADR